MCLATDSGHPAGSGSDSDGEAGHPHLNRPKGCGLQWRRGRLDLLACGLYAHQYDHVSGSVSG